MSLSFDPTKSFTEEEAKELGKKLFNTFDGSTKRAIGIVDHQTATARGAISNKYGHAVGAAIIALCEKYYNDGKAMGRW